MPDAKYCPREPTREMLDAVPLLSKGVIKADDAMRSVVWRAMYDAAQAEPREPTTDYERKCMTPPPDDWPPDRSGSPEEIRAAKERLKRLIREADDAPSPAAEDGLVERLKKWHAEVTEIDLYETSKVALIAEAAARIERQAQEIAEMKRERQARNAIDPVTRLHNICDAMAEDRADSPYSQEAWDAQDEAYREKCAELTAALRRAEALRDALQESGKALQDLSDLHQGKRAHLIDWNLVDRKAAKASAALAQGDDRG